MWVNIRDTITVHPSASRTRNMAPTPMLNIITSPMLTIHTLLPSRCRQMSAPMYMKFPATNTRTQFWVASSIAPKARPTNTPIRDMKLMNPLHITVCKLEKPFFTKMPTSPISRGIQCATIAITIGRMICGSLEAKPTPIPKPSKKLWTKEERRLRQPAAPLPLKFSQQVFSCYLSEALSVGSACLSPYTSAESWARIKTLDKLANLLSSSF